MLGYRSPLPRACASDRSGWRPPCPVSQKRQGEALTQAERVAAYAAHADAMAKLRLPRDFHVQAAPAEGKQTGSQFAAGRPVWYHVSWVFRHTYDRTDHLPEGTNRPESGGGDVLVVCLRAFKKPAVLRRLAQGDWSGAEEGGDNRGTDGGLVRLQAFAQCAVLRWDALNPVSHASNVIRETP